MNCVQYEKEPSLRQPTIILAFAGWNDAGSSASTAVRYLIEQLVATKFANIEPEEFYDFSVQRPHVRLDEQRHRQIQWPSYDFYYGSALGVDRDFIFGIGAEPHLRWKTFCDVVLGVAKKCSAEKIVTLGAYLDEVLYTRPVPITGFASDKKYVEELDLIPSRYQGPTGIIGVLGDSCRKAGLTHISFWGALPHYLSAAPNPRGALALVLRLTQWIGLRVDTGPLERLAAEFQHKVNEAINNDPNLSAFIRELKKREFEQ